MNRFDRVFWRRLWKLANPYWVSDQKWVALGLLACSLLLSGTVKVAYVVFSYVNRDMMTALASKDAAEFFHSGLLVLIYNIVAAPIIAVDGYVIGKLIIHWRQWLTEEFLARSFHDRAFYRISSDPGVDNPDQRISEDLNAFAGFTVSFVLQILWGFVTGASFLVVLWLISPILVGVLAACVAVGSVLTLVIGRPLIGINFTQRRREADFRHALVRLRDNTESIALYGGERNEEGRLLQRLYAVVKNSNLLISRQRNLAFFTYTYDFLLVLVPFFVLAPAFFAGTIEFGQITQASIAFLALRTAVSIIVDQYNLLSMFAAVVERLGGYLEAAESPEVLATGGSIALEEPPACSKTGEVPRFAIEALTIQTPDQRKTAVVGPRFAIEALTLRTPDNRKTLVRELSCEIVPGDRFLIVGESGVGKTSLLRAIAGLWRTGSGRIVRPPLSEMMFLPQRPYMILGSLRDQLCYPRLGGATDAELVAILQQVNLDDLPERVGGFDGEFKWKDLLSLGEQQQIAFARVLLSHPAYVFLDEATSALDSANEEVLYKSLASARITVVSVGNRAALRHYHHTVLELLGEGAWRLSRADCAGSDAGEHDGMRQHRLPEEGKEQ
ncbi:MAG: ABC transporter ATP-binding protein/permease [Deltaproteobacteria bacterium]|nr:ABC transporter ATP-binding protein/permease [Deltaproteobacteria bacterium]